MKTSITLLLAIGVLCGTAAKAYPSVSETWLSNLAEPIAGISGFGATGWNASSFSTDTGSYSLNSVTLPISGQSVPVTVEVMIYDDNAGNPGSLIKTLTGNPTVNYLWQGSLANSTFEDVTVLSSDVTLAPNTTYWLVTKATLGSGFWAVTSTTNAASPGSWSITGEHAVSFDSGNTWSTGTPGHPNMFSIDGTIIPEPAPWLAIAVGEVQPISYASAKPNRPEASAPAWPAQV